MSAELIPVFIIEIFPVLVVITAVIASILFAKDTTAAKAEGRSGKTAVKVFFIVSMSLLAVVAIQTIAVVVLGYLIMRSM